MLVAHHARDGSVGCRVSLRSCRGGARRSTARLLAWILVLLPTQVAASPKASLQLKLAVLGDSISTGAHAVNPTRNGYGARLGHLLEGAYETRVFARSSLCLLRQADLPYVDTDEFRAAIDWGPDVALVMLGTNDTIDSPRQNWRHSGDVENDALWLINRLRQRKPQAVVHLLGPPPFYPNQSDDADRSTALAAREPRRRPRLRSSTPSRG